MYIVSYLYMLGGGWKYRKINILVAIKKKKRVENEVTEWCWHKTPLDSDEWPAAQKIQISRG